MVKSDNGIHYEFLKKSAYLIPEKPAGKIVCVEDEVLIALSRIMQLKEQGFSVDENILTTGKEALDYIRNHCGNLSLILMDIGSKGALDGIETAEEIRKFDSRIPILFYSGYEDNKTRKRLEKITNSGFINKLSSNNELKDAINLMLN